MRYTSDYQSYLFDRHDDTCLDVPGLVAGAVGPRSQQRALDPVDPLQVQRGAIPSFGVVKTFTILKFVYKNTIIYIQHFDKIF